MDEVRFNNGFTSQLDGGFEITGIRLLTGFISTL